MKACARRLKLGNFIGGESFQILVLMYDGTVPKGIGQAQTRYKPKKSKDNISTIKTIETMKAVKRNYCEIIF